MPDRSRHAVERFPDLAEAIKQYSADNRFFCSLCEDYGEAVETLRRWQESEDPSTHWRVSACRDLIAELENDMLRELQRWNEAGSGTPDDDPCI
jgi:hypothetical protein